VQTHCACRPKSSGYGSCSWGVVISSLHFVTAELSRQQALGGMILGAGGHFGAEAIFAVVTMARAMAAVSRASVPSRTMEGLIFSSMVAKPRKRCSEKKPVPKSPVVRPNSKTAISRIVRRAAGVHESAVGDFNSDSLWGD